jgi:hypothetical protein
MRLSTIVIVGNGKTSRSNVEALLSDAFLLNKDLIVNFVSRTSQSEGITWAQQYTASSGIVGTVYGSDTSLDFEKVLKDNADRKIEFYILWDDEDFDCLEAIKFCEKNNLEAFDLTNGLVRIKPSKNPIEVPTLLDMPEVERTASVEPKKSDLKKVVIEEYDDEDEDEEDEDDDEEYESEGIIVEGIQEIARIFAMAIAAELKELLKPEDSDESK